MEQRVGPDRPSAAGAREHLELWEAQLAENRRWNEETRARVDAERAAKSAALKVEAEAVLAARQAERPLHDEMACYLRRSGTPTYREPAD